MSKKSQVTPFPRPAHIYILDHLPEVPVAEPDGGVSLFFSPMRPGAGVVAAAPAVGGPLVSMLQQPLR